MNIFTITLARITYDRLAVDYCAEVAVAKRTGDWTKADILCREFCAAGDAWRAEVAAAEAEDAAYNARVEMTRAAYYGE